MSSTAWNDRSLMESADAMSCETMLSLAKKEYHHNKQLLARKTIDNECDGSLKDRSAEHKLFLNGGISRNLCFEHDPALKTGEYFSQIENTRKESFEKWTRVKTIATPYDLNKKAPTYDLDSSFFDCAIPTDLVCAYNNGSKIDLLTCPPKCAPHPAPCPNPIK